MTADSLDAFTCQNFPEGVICKRVSTNAVTLTQAQDYCIRTLHATLPAPYMSWETAAVQSSAQSGESFYLGLEYWKDSYYMTPNGK